MYDKDNIFAKILRGELACNKVYKDNNVLPFKDLFPNAPVHVLVIPKGQYTYFDDFVASDTDIVGFFDTVQKIANKLGLVGTRYRVVTNHGADSGQIVPHFHVHILGGQKLGEIG